VIHTYEDVVSHLLDYLFSDPGETALRDAKKATQEAYRDLCNAFNWTYLYAPAQFITNPPFAAGAVTYQQTGGLFPRLVTLADPGVWPNWAQNAVLQLPGPVSGIDPLDTPNYFMVINNVYRIERRISDTQVTLMENSCPGIDFVTPTQANLYGDTYLLPIDFVSQDQTLIPNNFGNLQFIHPREWLKFTEGMQYVNAPTHYSIVGESRYPGRLVLHIAPFPDVSYPIHYAYKRRPRPLTYYQVSSGTAEIITGLDGNLTGLVLTQPVLTQAHVGSVIRFSQTTDLPTNESGGNPAVFESHISSVESAMNATLVEPADFPHTGVKYMISDPLDIEEGAMMTAFLRLSERKLSTIRIMKDREFPLAEYHRALEAAKSADSRSFMGRSSHVQIIDRRYVDNLWTSR
jgi:hypothetical protein